LRGELANNRAQIEIFGDAINYLPNIVFCAIEDCKLSP
jgi:hypothetical protein